MLVYIALQPDQVESRERLAARLWSDSGPRPRPCRAAPEPAAADPRPRPGRRPGRGRPHGDPADPPGDARHRRGAGSRPTAASPRGCWPTRGSDLSRIFADLEDIDRRVQPLDRGAARAAGLAADRQARGGAGRSATPRRAPSASPRRCRGSIRPTRAPAGRRCRRTWRSATPRRRCAATSGCGRCSTRSSTSSRRRRRRRSTSRSSRARCSRALPARRQPSQDLLAPIAIVVEPIQALELPRAFGYFGRDLPRRDDRGAGPLPRLAGDRRRARRPRPRPPTAPIPADHPARPRRCDHRGDAASRPGGRPPDLVRAADRDARRDAGAAPHRAAQPRGGAERAPLGAAAAVGARGRRARWGASTSSGCRRRR